MTAVVPRTWLPERIAQVMALIEGGCTYAQVADRMGVTKNAIAGVLNRYDRRDERPEALAFDQDRVTQGGCRWIDGDPTKGDWTWCAAPTVDAGPYCAEHRRRAWTSERRTGNG